MSNAKPEPFGYFHALPFGWAQCSEHDDGAVALYEHPPTATDDRIAVLEIEHGVFFERWHAERRQREALQAEVARLAAPNAAPYYISGPAPDGAWLVCEVASGRVVHRIAEHIGTHAPGCHAWGPRHYACAQTELQRLAGENGVLRGLLSESLGYIEDLAAEPFKDSLPGYVDAVQALRDRVRAALAGEAGGLL